MFKVNDEVWSPRFGDGKIIAEDDDSDYPIRVKFNDIEDVVYSIDGKYSNYDLLPSLFFKGTTINSAPEPKRFREVWLNLYYDRENKVSGKFFVWNSKEEATKAIYKPELHELVSVFIEK